MRDGNTLPSSTLDREDFNFAEKALNILRALGAEEVELEVSQIYLPHLVELSKAGKVMAIDVRDPAGGFGGVDLLVAAVVPALAAALAGRSRGAGALEIEAAIDEILFRVGSPRAKLQRDELIQELCR